MARMDPTVNTPVPPTPVINTFQGRASSARRGAGSSPKPSAPFAAAGLRNLPPMTETKLGQKPSTQV